MCRVHFRTRCLALATTVHSELFSFRKERKMGNMFLNDGENTTKFLTLDVASRFIGFNIFNSPIVSIF